MQLEEREASILNLLMQRSGFTAFDAMEKALPFSSATLRRDLQRMAREGRIQRIRGGAKLASANRDANTLPSRLSGVPFRENISRHRRQKEAIGRTAASLCVPASTVMIDGGSTTLQMCRHLQGLELQVVTNSLHIVTALLLQPGTRVCVLNGVVFPEQNIILNRAENDVNPSHEISQLFLSAAALGTRGIMQADPFLGAAQRRLIDRAREVILLLDSSKFRGSGYVVCDCKEVDVVITDAAVTKQDLSALQSANIKVIIAR